MNYKCYHIITIGCQMNKSDSERVSGFLSSHGLEAAKVDKADIVIINTCGVRQSAEDRAYGLVKRVQQDNERAKIVITGCLSKRKDVIKRLKYKVDLFLPINELPNMFSLLAGKTGDVKDKIREIKGEEYLKIIPIYSNNFSAYVPIGNGCNNFCSYCVVPYARGREVYRPYSQIIDEVKGLVEKGFKEIILIAQNVNSYRYENKDFADLLLEVNALDGDFWICFFSSHPKDMSDKLIAAMGKADKLVKYLHLAVQSGDDEILRKMNRKYKADDYIKLIGKLRKTKKNISITTDIIVGFPSETKKQFKNTKKLLKKVKFDLAYVSQYSPRPGTASFNMKDDVSPEDKKIREEKLLKILQKTSQKNNRKYLGQKLKVLVEGKNRRGRYFGKTNGYKTVKFNNDRNDLAGKFVEVKIIRYENFSLIGELID